MPQPAYYKNRDAMNLDENGTYAYDLAARSSQCKSSFSFDPVHCSTCKSHFEKTRGMIHTMKRLGWTPPENFL